MSSAAGARALAAALLLGTISPAWAAPGRAAPRATQQAKAHFRAGAELYRQGRYREAIAEFEAANRLRAHGVISFNLARCHERLGRLSPALRAYHEYLRALPDAEDRAGVAAAMRGIEARLAESGVQQLLVVSDPPGAEVRIDGQPRGKAPLAVLLPQGPHALALSKPGFATLAREAVLAPDRSLEMDVSLQVAGPAAPAAPPAAPR